jgi:hypothetical protein
MINSVHILKEASLSCGRGASQPRVITSRGEAVTQLDLNSFNNGTYLFKILKMGKCLSKTS